jgi:hypothetical protein
MARSKATNFGEASDARNTLAVAQKEIARAKTVLDTRQAAEKFYLAATQAADQVAVRQGRQAPEGTGARLQALTRLDDATRGRTQTRQLFADALTFMHGECFHERRCDTAKLKKGARATAALVAQVAKHVGFD